MLSYSECFIVVTLETCLGMRYSKSMWMKKFTDSIVVAWGGHIPLRLLESNFDSFKEEYLMHNCPKCFETPSTLFVA
jgi:hypothetical protein